MNDNWVWNYGIHLNGPCLCVCVCGGGLLVSSICTWLWVFIKHSYVSFILLLRSLISGFLWSLCKKKQPSTESAVHHTKTNLPNSLIRAFAGHYTGSTEQKWIRMCRCPGLSYFTLITAIMELCLVLKCGVRNAKMTILSLRFGVISYGTDKLFTCPSLKKSQFWSVLPGTVSTDTIFL